MYFVNKAIRNYCDPQNNSLEKHGYSTIFYEFRLSNFLIYNFNQMI